MIAQDQSSPYSSVTAVPLWAAVPMADGNWHVIKIQQGHEMMLVMTDKRCNKRCAEEVANALNRIYRKESA